MVRIAKRRRFDVVVTRRSNKVYPGESDMSWERSIAGVDHRNSEILPITTGSITDRGTNTQEVQTTETRLISAYETL